MKVSIFLRAICEKVDYGLFLIVLVLEKEKEYILEQLFILQSVWVYWAGVDFWVDALYSSFWVMLVWKILDSCVSGS